MEKERKKGRKRTVIRGTSSEKKSRASNASRRELNKLGRSSEILPLTLTQTDTQPEGVVSIATNHCPLD